MGDICRKLGMTEASYYRRQMRFANLGVPESRKFRQLRDVIRKRVCRVWCRAGLTLPRRKSYRRSRGGKRVDPVAGVPNEVGASDIIQTYCANGRKVRCLTVLDE